MADYQYVAEGIDYAGLPKTIAERTPKLVCELVAKGNFVVDVHTHYFDMLCINKKYFLIRMIKDFLGLKSVANGETMQLSIDEVYEMPEQSTDNWNQELLEQMDKKEVQFINLQEDKKGFVDLIAARKLLGIKTMADMYWYYLDKCSLAKSFDNIPDDNVLTSVLMMDLEMGWETSLPKTFYEQVEEVKEMTKQFPVLPFLACDPRRAKMPDPKKDLYRLFSKAFCEGISFFGVKIYPAMGYHPSDYRLWPIYEICERYEIPIISHNGGGAVSTNNRDFIIYAGEEAVNIQGSSREDVAYQLNDPLKWEIALNKFPKLKLDLAHFGSASAWRPKPDAQNRKATIIRLMNEYPNVYADFSFSLADLKASRNLKNTLVSDELVRSRTLFGSDFWVVSPEGNLHLLQNDFINLLDENFLQLDLKTILSKTNPMKFLFGK